MMAVENVAVYRVETEKAEVVFVVGVTAGSNERPIFVVYDNSI